MQQRVLSPFFAPVADTAASSASDEPAIVALRAYLEARGGTLPQARCSLLTSPHGKPSLILWLLNLEKRLSVNFVQLLILLSYLWAQGLRAEVKMRAAGSSAGYSDTVRILTHMCTHTAADAQKETQLFLRSPLVFQGCVIHKFFYKSFSK